MKVLWADAAVAQLQAIYDYVAQTSPEYALRLIDRLTNRSIQIATFPFSGRVVPEYDLKDVREIIEGSFRIIYLINHRDQQLEILAVIHSARESLRPLK
ncbi:MAG TPA: type II toxin-antitoxin system RelE/ParE family toxin [Pyrinomonadaceae bacterium]|jgi:plasmid stabilization system protein ParE|nr:type II toxin-antitoxin system RelE/ParE family toxin [Pyrinomonadaceae bacterium]